MDRLPAIALIASMAGLALGMFWLGRETATGREPLGAVTQAPEGPSAEGSTRISARSSGPPLPERSSTIAVPAHYAFEPGQRVAPVGSWEALLSELDPDQRASAEAFADRYPEAYQFTTAEQLAWMVEHGYPMPEEIAAADSLSLDELLRRAEAGNLKAMMLAVDRGTREHEGGEPDPDDRERNASLARLSALQHRMRESCSPFAAYAGARLLQSMARDDAGLYLLANLSFAQARGDWRVNATIEDIARAMSIPPDALAAMALLHSAYADVLVERCRGMPFPQPGG